MGKACCAFNLLFNELPLTYFEAMIAAAFVHFHRENVAVGVVEGALRPTGAPVWSIQR